MSFQFLNSFKYTRLSNTNKNISEILQNKIVLNNNLQYKLNIFEINKIESINDRLISLEENFDLNNNRIKTS